MRVLSSLLRSWRSGNGRLGELGHAREIDGLTDRHRVPFEWRIGHDVETEAPRILRDERRRENERHVVACLAPKTAARRELPEVARARALETLQNSALTRVVCGHREVPVPEHLVQVAEIGRGGARGLHRIAPLVEGAIPLETVTLARAGDELPEAVGGGARVGLVLEGRLDHRDVDEILRNALLLEDAAHELEVAPFALEGRRKGHGSPELVEGDGLEHGVVHDDRNVEAGSRSCRAQLRLGLLDFVRRRERRCRDEAVTRVFGGRPFGFGRARAGSDRGTVKGDRVVELVRECEVGQVALARGDSEGLESVVEGLASAVALARERERLALVELLGGQRACGGIRRRVFARRHLRNRGTGRGRAAGDHESQEPGRDADPQRREMNPDPGEGAQARSPRDSTRP